MPSDASVQLKAKQMSLFVGIKVLGKILKLVATCLAELATSCTCKAPRLGQWITKSYHKTAFLRRNWLAVRALPR